MCYLGIDKAIEDPSVCLRALHAVLVAPLIYPFALARGVAGVEAKGFPGAWSATQKLSRNGYIPAKPQVWCSVRLVSRSRWTASHLFLSFDLSYLRALHNDQGCQDHGGRP